MVEGSWGYPGHLRWAGQEGTHGKDDVPWDLNNGEAAKQKSGQSISGSENDDDDDDDDRADI